MIKLHTNHGVIALNCSKTKRRLTVANFIEYVKAGHYDNTDFPPGDQQLHDPRRRFRAGHETKSHSRHDPERSRQRLVEQSPAPWPWPAP